MSSYKWYNDWELEYENGRMIKQFMFNKIKQTFLFAVLYFLCMGLGVLVNHFIDKSGVMFYAPALTGVFGGLIYFYFLSRIRQFGMITLVGVMMGGFFLLTGHIALAFVPGLLFGLLADLMAKRGNYINKTSNNLSFLLFGFVTTGPIFLMWLARSQYVAALVARGKSSDYINRVLLPADGFTISWFIFTVIAGAALGAFLGSWVNEKYLKQK